MYYITMFSIIVLVLCSDSKIEREEERRRTKGEGEREREYRNVFVVMGRDSVTDVNATDCCIPLKWVSSLLTAVLSSCGSVEGRLPVQITLTDALH